MFHNEIMFKKPSIMRAQKENKMKEKNKSLEINEIVEFKFDLYSHDKSHIEQQCKLVRMLLDLTPNQKEKNNER